MALGTISGVISNITTPKADSGKAGQAQGQARTRQPVVFTLNGKIVVFRGTPALSNGDEVTIAGDAETEFKALALRNKTTGALYKANAQADIGWLVLAAAPPAVLLALLWYIGVHFMGLVLVVDFLIILCTISYLLVHSYRANRLLARSTSA